MKFCFNFQLAPLNTGLLSDHKRVIATVISEAKELKASFKVPRKTLIQWPVAAGTGGSSGGGMLGDGSGGSGTKGAQTEEVSLDADAARMAKKLGISLEKLDAEGLVIMTNRGGD